MRRSSRTLITPVRIDAADLGSYGGGRSARHTPDRRSDHAQLLQSI